MPQKTGYEDDWINALNATGNLANTLSNVKTKGLQTEAYLRELEEKERQDGLANVLTSGLDSGKTSKDLSAITSIPGRQPEKKWWQSEADKPVDIPVGSAEVQSGLKTALENRIATTKAISDDKYNTALNALRGQPIEKVLAMGDDLPGDMFRARGQYLLEYAQQDIPKAAIRKTRDEAADELYKKTMGDIKLGESYASDGDYETAGNIWHDAINESNLDFQSKKQTDGTYILYLDTPEGLKTDGVKHAPKDLGVLIKDRLEKGPHHRSQIRAQMELAEKDNAASIKNPLIMVEPGTNHMVQTVRSTDPRTHKITYTNFDKNDKKIGNLSPDQLREAGFFDYKKEFYKDDGAARLESAKIRKEEAGIGLIRAQTDKARAGSGVGKSLTVPQMKYMNTEFNKDAISKNFKNGIDLAISEEGILYSLKPLNKVQMVELQSFAEERGYTASMRPNENGGYDFKGFAVPDKAPVGAAGLGGGNSSFNKERAALEGKGEPKGKTKDKENDSPWIVPMEREPGAEKAAQAVKKVVGRVGDAFSGSHENTNQIKLDKLKKERVKYPNDKSLKYRISQLEKAMGK